MRVKWILVIVLIVFTGCGFPAIIPDDSTTIPTDSTTEVLDVPVKSEIPVLVEPEEVEPLSISNVRVTNISYNSAVVRWETNRPATSLVKYRKGRWSASAVYSEEDTSHKEIHRVRLYDLRAGTVYCVYSIVCTGSDSVEHRKPLVFTTGWSDAFWGDIDTGGGYERGDESGDITTTWNGGDGSWDGDLWKVSAYPAESKSCKFKVYNGTSHTITVWADTTLISYPAGGEGEGIFASNSVTIASKASKNLVITISFAQSAPVGVYIGDFNLKY